MKATYLTTADLAAQLRVHKNTIRVWTKSGILPPPVKFNRATRWRVSDLVEAGFDINLGD